MSFHDAWLLGQRANRSPAVADDCWRGGASAGQQERGTPAVVIRWVRRRGYRKALWRESAQVRLHKKRCRWQRNLAAAAGMTKSAPFDT